MAFMRTISKDEGIFVLPVEVLLLILLHADINTLLQLRLVNHFFLRLSHDATIWKNLAQFHFPKQITQQVTNWYSFFKTTAITNTASRETLFSKKNLKNLLAEDYINEFNLATVTVPPVFTNILKQYKPLKNIPRRLKRDLGDVFVWLMSQNNTAGVLHCLRQKIDVSSQNMHRDTALNWSAQHGNVLITQLLLMKGADPNVSNESNDTPLITAAWKGHVTIVRLLLNAGADPDHCNDLQNNALHYAQKLPQGNARESIVNMLEKAIEEKHAKTCRCILS